MNRLHSLDGLRAVACLLVLAHHLGIAAFSAALSQKGYPFFGKLLGSLTASGVELFFVLSAAVLVGPYVRGEKQLNIKSYLLRRIERLMPPYLAAWCVAGLAIYLATAYPTWWTRSAALPPFSILSWVEQLGIVYFGLDRYNFAWWSLTTEVAFYILLPIFIPLFASWHKSPIRLGGIFLGSLVIAILAYSYLNLGILVLRDLAIYASCFCAGLVLACQVPARALAHSLWILGSMWIGAACTSAGWNIHVGWGLVYFGLVALAMHPESALTKMLSSLPWVWLGERSYSFFLVHYSVIGLVCHAFSIFFPNKSLEYFIYTRATSFTLSILAAILIFHFIERRAARNLTTANAFWPWSKNRTAVDSKTITLITALPDSVRIL